MLEVASKVDAGTWIQQTETATRVIQCLAVDFKRMKVVIGNSLPLSCRRSGGGGWGLSRRKRSLTFSWVKNLDPQHRFFARMAEA